MRILHVVESHTIHTSRVVDHQLAQGHQVRVATAHDFVGMGPVSLFEIRPWATRLPFSHHWAGILQFASMARGFKPDVIHGHYLSTAALFLASAPGVPCVASAVGSDVLVDPRAAHARLLMRLVSLWVDRFIAVAPHVRDRMIQLGIDVAKIETLPWGVDAEMFHPAETMPRGLSVISTRSFEAVYDLDTLLRAAEIVGRAGTRLRLALYGDGSLRAALVARARELGIVEHVRFEGRVAPRVLAGALRGASVYVSTALSDGASTSLLEAMATGLVPVVADIPANRAWISHRENGILFRPGDAGALASALEQALSNPELRARCYEVNPALVASRATWAACMERLEAIYREVTS